MKNKTTENSAVGIDVNIEVAIITRVTAKFSLKFKKLAVATSLGLAAFAASLP